MCPTPHRLIIASAGIAQTGITWGLAEGELGGPRGFQTYVLIANPSSEAAEVDVLVDPGQAFGTGANATTRMCLELMLELADQEFTTIRERLRKEGG